MYYVVVTDDHAVIRQGVRRGLSSFGDLTVAAEAGSSEELMAVLSRHRCDVLILDISLGGERGLEILAQAKQAKPALAVVMFTMHDNADYARQALAAGAKAYVSKSRPMADLATAIRRATCGLTYLSPPFDQMDLAPDRIPSAIAHLPTNSSCYFGPLQH